MISEIGDVFEAENYYIGEKQAESAVCERYVDLYAENLTLRYVQVLVKNHGRTYRALFDPEIGIEAAQQSDSETLPEFFERVIESCGQFDGKDFDIRFVDEDGECDNLEEM